jgi:hypothetical protein
MIIPESRVGSIAECDLLIFFRYFMAPRGSARPLQPAVKRKSKSSFVMSNMASPDVGTRTVKSADRRRSWPPRHISANALLAKFGRIAGWSLEKSALGATTRGVLSHSAAMRTTCNRSDGKRFGTKLICGPGHPRTPGPHKRCEAIQAPVLLIANATMTALVNLIS